jgi:hypothetical protein
LKEHQISYKEAKKNQVLHKKAQNTSNQPLTSEKTIKSATNKLKKFK